MARERSIPHELEHVIYTLWAEGSSPNEILDWIEDSNQAREKPVETSRASIIRLLERYSKQADQALVMTIQRFRAQSMEMADHLDEIMNLCLNTITNAKDMIRTEGDTKWRQWQLRYMKVLENQIFRRLQLAGVTGREGRNLLNQHRAEMAKAVAEIEQQELPQPSAEPEAPAKSARSNEAISSETSTIQSDTPPPEPMTELPVLKRPDGDWTLSEKSWWFAEEERVNGYLQQAWDAGARDLVPLQKAIPLPPTGDSVGDQMIRLFTRPTMRMTDEQRAEIDAQMRMINPWLIWMRRKIDANCQAA